MSRKSIALAVFCFLLLLNAGCATQPGNPTLQDASPLRSTMRASEDLATSQQFAVYDPLEGVNRRLYKFNAEFDTYVFLPVVDAYDFIVPPYANDRISSLFSNLGEFSNATNSVLQGNVDKTATAVGRFVVNTTVGLLGLYDPAKHMGLNLHREDFGQTLGSWGVGSGAYIVLPILGPSNVRDTVGMVADALAFSYLVPNRIEDTTPYRLVEYGLKPINTRANLDFEYYETGSPFEYELIRYVTAEQRRLEIEK